MKESIEKRAYRHSLLFTSKQAKYTQKAIQVKDTKDNSAAILKEKAEKRKKEVEDKYLGKEEREWVDSRDERSGKKMWKNVNTGEITFDDPYADGNAKLSVAQKATLEAKKRREEAKKKKNNKKGL